MADHPDPKKTQADVRAREILDSVSPDVLKALKRELDNRAKVGRPKGSGQDDSEAIDLMVNLLRTRKVESDSEAVAAAVLRFPGHSKAATRKRLARKLTEHLNATAKSPEELAREARRAEVLRRAFEEDVAWDI